MKDKDLSCAGLFVGMSDSQGGSLFGFIEERLMMKVIKKLLCFLLALFILFCVFVMVCAFNPDITDAVADFLYSDQSTETLAESEAEPVIVDILTGQGINTVNSDGYLQPDQDEINIPDDVSGKSGYTPIKEDGRQIGEEEAAELTWQLGPGETGDDLVFDPLFYPYYFMLDEKGQHLYRQIYANANSLNTAFTPLEQVQVEELKNIFAAVYNDHPELFWVETAYYCKYRENGQCAEIDLMFNRTAQNLAEAKTVFEEKAGQIINDAQNLSSDYEKEKYVHDVLIDLTAYQTSAEMGQSAYSALVNGRTVCAGYARAFQYIMQQLGIPCYYCTGYSGENHAWNIVMLDDGYYNVDVTWDDIEEGTYDYFNKSDDDYASTHIRREMSVNLPPCSGERYRNLETDDGTESSAENEETDIRRSLEELGIGQDEVIYNLADYYADCYQKITGAGIGSYTFYSVLEGEEFLQQWISSYQSEEYKAGYMESAMEAVGAGRCEMKLELEELQGGQYLVTHEITLK